MISNTTSVSKVLVAVAPGSRGRHTSPSMRSPRRQSTLRSSLLSPQALRSLPALEARRLAALLVEMLLPLALPVLLACRHCLSMRRKCGHDFVFVSGSNTKP